MLFKFLITNQMTTRITRDANTNGTISVLVPALGETWAHSANMRIVLTWKNNKRSATITKSSYMPDAVIYYKISVSLLVIIMCFGVDQKIILININTLFY